MNSTAPSLITSVCYNLKNSMEDRRSFTIVFTLFEWKERTGLKILLISFNEVSGNQVQ